MHFYFGINQTQNNLKNETFLLFMSLRSRKASFPKKGTYRSYFGYILLPLNGRKHIAIPKEAVN